MRTIDVHTVSPLGFLAEIEGGFSRRADIIVEVKALYDQYGARPGFVGQHQEVVPWLPLARTERMWELIRDEVVDALSLEWWSAWPISGPPAEAAQEGYVTDRWQTMFDACGTTEIAVTPAPAELIGQKVLTARATYDFLIALDGLSIHCNAVRKIPSTGAMFLSAVKEQLKENAPGALSFLEQLLAFAKIGIVVYAGFRLVDLFAHSRTDRT